MQKRIRVRLNDEEYLLVKGKWLDSHFIEPPINIAIQLTEQILNDGTVEEYSNEELEKFILGFKGQGLTGKALQIAEVLYGRYLNAKDMYKLRWLMPIETSLLRMSNTPQKAIDFFTLQTEKFGNTVNSPQLLTSVAAAYCDTRDYINAKRLCDWAYSWGGASTELSAVYERIKKETGDKN